MRMPVLSARYILPAIANSYLTTAEHSGIAGEYSITQALPLDQNT